MSLNQQRDDDPLQVPLGQFIIDSTTSTTIIWTTMLNAGYIEYAANFLASLRRCGSTMRIVFFCLDDESLQFVLTATSHWSSGGGSGDIMAVDGRVVLQKYGRIQQQQSAATTATSSLLLLWNTDAYKRMMFAKLDFIRYTIEAAAAAATAAAAAATAPTMIQIDVGYIDLDIVLLKCPDAGFRFELDRWPEACFVAQCDENGCSACSNPERCPNICAGLMVFRTALLDMYHSLFLYDTRMITAFQNADQEYLQRILAMTRRDHIPYRTVKRSQFLNGTFQNMHRTPRTRRSSSSTNNNKKKIAFPEDTVLVHFNYIVGAEKKRIMKDQGMWFIDDDDV